MVANLAVGFVGAELMDEVGDYAFMNQVRSLSAAEMKELNAQMTPPGLAEYFRSIFDGAELAEALGALDIAENGMKSSADVMADAKASVIEDRILSMKSDPEYAGYSESMLRQIALEQAHQSGTDFAQEANEKRAKIRSAANEIFKAVDSRWNCDEAVIYEQLASLSPNEMNLLRDEYLRHFGKSLDVALAEGMGPWDAKVAEKMMSQDPNTRTEGMIEYLENNSQSWYGTEDEEFIFSSLENLSVEERTRLVQDPRFGAVLEGWYDDLGTNEYALVEALTRLDPTTGRAEANPAHVAAAKIKIAMHGGTAWKFWEGMGTDESTIESELSKLTPEQVQEMEAYYNQYLGRMLDVPSGCHR